jgi:glycyl-tRNA synthetase beta chain
MEDSVKVVKDFKSYLKLLKDKNVILDHNLRKKYIIEKINKISKSKSITSKINEQLLNEVNDLVEKPKVIACKFNSNFLNIPEEILITSMQQNQKYFPTFDQKGDLTNIFLVVTNCDDKKGFIKLGNERVIEARLSDANFFWKKNKSQNLVKQVVNLKAINFFTKLGSLYEKVQRIRKLGSLTSDQLNYNKEKIEIAASICKVDLLSDLVGEYPELQGVMGSYFAKEQGFEDDIALAIKEHYLPIGLDSKIPKKATSIVVAIVDKIDTLVGFFGIDEKPTSSKDPFALRRAAFGLVRIIIENNLKLELKDLINYSMNLYQDQGFKLSNQTLQNDLLTFITERLKNYLKEKKIRIDIIEAAISSQKSDDFVSLFKKCQILNKSIDNISGKYILASYKRASNILDQEIKKNRLDIRGMPDSVLFKKEEEKILFDEINEIRKYLSSNFKNQNYEKTLEILANSKKNIDNFFDNVVVNDENESIKKNRLELLKMLCMTLDNFINFSKIEGS